MQKNVSGQFFHAIAFNTTGRVKSDAANLTCTLSIDDGAYGAIASPPTEIGSTGEYKFSISQSETNGSKLSFVPVSSTVGVQVLGVPSNVIYPSDEATVLANQTTIIANIASISTASSTGVSRNPGKTLNAFVGETTTFQEVPTFAVDGTVLDCTSIALTVTIETLDGTDVELILDGALTKSATGIIFTTAAATSNATTSQKIWSARRDDTGESVNSGRYNVETIARKVS